MCVHSLWCLCEFEAEQRARRALLMRSGAPGAQPRGYRKWGEGLWRTRRRTVEEAAGKATEVAIQATLARLRRASQQSDR